VEAQGDVDRRDFCKGRTEAIEFSFLDIAQYSKLFLYGHGTSSASARIHASKHNISVCYAKYASIASATGHILVYTTNHRQLHIYNGSDRFPPPVYS
jgi:hypothetical protein